MSSDTSSMPDIEEYMASICDQNGKTVDNIHNITTSCDDECSSDEVEVIKELKVNLDKHECDLCCEGTFLVNKLLQFGGVLNDEYKHACDICNVGFKTKADVYKHKKLHEDGVLSEDSCIQNLTSLLYVPDNSHEISSSTPSSSRKKSNSSAPVVCDTCYKIFKSEKTLKTHKKNQHSNIIYTCEVCTLKFSKFRDFKKHCGTHTNLEKFITCPTCKKQFLYKNSIKKHVCALKT
ncbi:zinc finger protein 62-like [Argiope bruennichi]|uniref:zinc finger protein 62-like n=1 Tax=Argiope bruennichi TaxID=94029 RepID=UPI0024941DFB|nr:zinc finger protein 62-like [Argiope bruennichi]